MNNNLKTFLVIAVLFIASISLSTEQVMMSRLAITIANSEKNTDYSFRGKHHQKFETILEELKEFVRIDNTLHITFIAYNDVSVNEIWKPIFAVRSLGFTQIFIETCEGNSPTMGDLVFHRVQVIPVVDNYDELNFAFQDVSDENDHDSDEKQEGIVKFPEE